ncbi:MAG: DUF488 domain-containing protein [Thermoleophilaceae bacterium]
MPGRRVLTIGHSTHDLPGLVALLRRHEVQVLADVRRFPGSRRLPHFNRGALEDGLSEASIAYRHLPELGGRRAASPDSAHAGWRVEGFRGYAEYMESEEFAAGLDRLLAVAGERLTAVMCAEGLWWRCHRRLVADALLVRGWPVEHVAPDGGTSEHELTDFAVVQGERIAYRAPQQRLGA